MNNMRRVALGFSCMVLAVLTGWPLSVQALSNIAQVYAPASGISIAPGELVSTENAGAGEVTPADTTNGHGLAGISVASEQAVVSVAAGAPAQSVTVVNGGTAAVYVSTLNGAIHRGDRISVSPIAGIGMKAAVGLYTIGTAEADFSAGTSPVTYQVPKVAGGTQTVHVGSIPVAILVGSGIAASEQSGVIANLQSVAAVVAGHQVSALRAVLSFVIAVVSVGALIALIYGAIHASIDAMGRNLLARRSILRTLTQVTATACLIVAVAAVVLYFTLR